MIEVKNGTFHLSNGQFSYCFYEDGGRLYHSYYGKALQNACGKKEGGGDGLMFEYGEFGRGDFRAPALVAHKEDLFSTEFVYKSYKILKEKPSLGMPALRGGETLAVTLEDKVAGLQLVLFYTVYGEGLARHAEIVNISDRPVHLDKAMSLCLELPADNYEAINLYGRANNERIYSRDKVISGVRTIGSACGVTSHAQSSFLAVLQENATEEQGEVYGFHLIYCGNFSIEIEKTECSELRVNIGENILYGGIELKAGERWITPEAVTVYSAEGLGQMSRSFHRLYRKHLLDPRYADKIRPVVINSWESCVYDISEENLKKLIESARGLGIDTVVLDDGWFGKRDDDTTSLGDWHVDIRKFPNGLNAVIDCCKQNGMKFGIWFEPEAISPQSELYAAHPDWAIATKGREGVRIRNQYVLDFSKKEVVEHVFHAIECVLKKYDISYLKWDMNRYLTDVVSARQYHDYVSGVYGLYERLTKAFPNVLIEGCASGGGRFEPSVLYYSPMIWTSDNTDAWCRAGIQYATSLCFPLQTMSNHVSHCPNNQTGRITPFSTRGAVASLGCLGYELNTSSETECTKEERAAIAAQIAGYRRDAALILTGELYRLRNPFTDNAFCEMVVSEDREQAYFVYVRGLNAPKIASKPRVLLKGLDADTVYEIEEREGVFTGEELMRVGIQLELEHGDFTSEILHIKSVEE